MTQQCHEPTIDTARWCLDRVQLLLRKFLLKSDNQTFALRDGTIKAAEHALMWVEPFIEDSRFPENKDAFEGWKTMFVAALNHFESALSVDIEALPIFLLEPKRGYAVDTLLQKIEDCLPEEHRGWLSDFALDNMQEGGACLAFHRYTACGYHMARAVEDVARNYYELVKAQSRTVTSTGRDRNLKQIAGELDDLIKGWKGKSEPGLLPLIIPSIRNFCRIYRDPLSHADLELKTLSASEAEIAFGHAISAISTMIEDVRNGGSHIALQL